MAPELETHRELVRLAAMGQKFVPTRFASSQDPSQIGSVKRENKWLAAYAGARYQRFRNSILKITLRNVRISYAPPFLDESFRIAHFTNALVSLGWHSDANIRNGVVGERVFEGLSYGARVVTDNPWGEELTDGLAVYVSNHHEAAEEILRTRKDRNYFSSVQKQAYVCSREHGTYKTTVQDFIQLF